MHVIVIACIDGQNPANSVMKLKRGDRVEIISGDEVDTHFRSGIYWARNGLPNFSTKIRWMQVTGGNSDHAFIDDELTSLCGKITRSKHQAAGTGHGRKCKRCLDELNASPPDGD